MHLNKKVLSLVALLALCSVHGVSSNSSTSLEETVSRRQSIRSYTNENITSQQLLEVLRAGYGFWSGHRSIPQIGNDYSLTIFPINATGSYRYIPENNLLAVHNLSVNKETIRPHINQDYVSTASVVLIAAWNRTKMDNWYFPSAEAGCLVQNVYLAAVSINLGTCCVTSIDSDGLRNDLALPHTIIPLLVMPLGFPTSPYPPASPNYAFMTGNLPRVQYSQVSFTDALDNMLFAQVWSGQGLGLQELSQLLWAAYGYTNVTYSLGYHRTTPSAMGIYPLVIYVSNITGTFRYVAETHSVQLVQAGDKRLDIANACGGQVWAANAPAVFLVVYNSSGYEYDYGVVPHEWIEVDAGCVIQQLSLEASAWNLSANIVTNGLEEWNGTAAQEVRNILGLPSSLVPLYPVPIGHKIGYKLNICVKAWDFIDSIQGAYVYKDSEWRISDENGWANWTDASGTVAIKVKWFGVWVNGTFTITMNEDKTIDLRCNIFDTVITCVEEKQKAPLQYVNVTVFAGESRIESGTTSADGKTSLTNLPNSTLTFVAYDFNNNLIANETRTITSEGQQETIICNKNYETSQMTWEITEVLVHSAFAILPLTPILFITFRMVRLKQRIKTMSCSHLKKEGG